MIEYLRMRGRKKRPVNASGEWHFYAKLWFSVRLQQQKKNRTKIKSKCVRLGDDIPFLFSICFRFYWLCALVFYGWWFDPFVSQVFRHWRPFIVPQQTKKETTQDETISSLFTTNLLLVAKTPATRHSRTQFYHQWIPAGDIHFHIICVIMLDTSRSMKNN